MEKNGALVMAINCSKPVPVGFYVGVLKIKPILSLLISTSDAAGCT